MSADMLRWDKDRKGQRLRSESGKEAGLQVWTPVRRRSNTLDMALHHWRNGYRFNQKHAIVLHAGLSPHSVVYWRAGTPTSTDTIQVLRGLYSAVLHGGNRNSTEYGALVVSSR